MCHTQVLKQLARLSANSAEPEIVAACAQPLVQEHDPAESGGVYKLDPRQIEFDVISGLGEPLDVGTQPAHTCGVHIFGYFEADGHGQRSSLID